MIERDADGRVVLPGTTKLAGSALTLDAAVARAVRETGLPIDDVLPMASTIPAARVGASTAGRVVAAWDAGTGSLTVGHVNGA